MKLNTSMKVNRITDEVWEIPGHLCAIPHINILTKPMERRLARTFGEDYETARRVLEWVIEEYPRNAAAQ